MKEKGQRNFSALFDLQGIFEYWAVKLLVLIKCRIISSVYHWTSAWGGRSKLTQRRNFPTSSKKSACHSASPVSELRIGYDTSLLQFKLFNVKAALQAFLISLNAIS